MSYESELEEIQNNYNMEKARLCPIEGVELGTGNCSDCKQYAEAKTLGEWLR